MGVAVDYSGMMTRKTNYEDLANAAALAAANSGETDHAVLETIATRYVSAYS
ncbi:MAG: pilus assembly protein TadG-related protein [Robiginitomaculum sp.]